MSPVFAGKRKLDDPVELDRLSPAGKTLGRVVLDPSYFSVPANVPLMHQVVTAQLAGRRAGTQSTKTRSEVSGGGSKPYRQKGTGNARQGSTRAPHYSGGGVALGPKPRSYAQATPKKMIQQALRCALSDRARTGGLRLVGSWDFDAPKTKNAVAALSAISAEGRVLVVNTRDDEAVDRSFANLPHVVVVPPDQLTAFDVLGADVVVFSDATLPGETTEVQKATATKPKPAAKKAVADEAVTDEAAEAGE